jgi:crotonobetainyl-CoA:carnitine CoA-transferase CaiB-like acyl-CoA transferase
MRGATVQGVLEGVRVLEVATWTFVPAAGAVLADWGADVIKVEHPKTGDPQRGLITAGMFGGGARAVNFMIEQPNRGKRSIGIDLRSAGGLEILYKLAEVSDVFLTSFLPAARQEMRIDVEHMRARNPNIIYVRGSGMGQRGPERERGGYDAAAYFARGGHAAALTPDDVEYPVDPRAAYGDLPGGQTLAGGIAAALFRRERHGVPSVVDASLLSCAMWTLAPDIVSSKLFGIPKLPRGDRRRAPNPLVSTYRTKDGRFINLTMLESDRYWPDLCRRLGRPELSDNPRFATAALRGAHGAECVDALDDTFAERTLVEWKEALADALGVWAVCQEPLELHDDPQAIENGYLVEVATDEGTSFTLVANPVQFDETSPALTRAPEHGEHTEAVLLELGLEWGEIITLKEAGAVL